MRLNNNRLLNILCEICLEKDILSEKLRDRLSQLNSMLNFNSQSFLVRFSVLKQQLQYLLLSAHISLQSFHGIWNYETSRLFGVPY